jgi:hypothetical protein
MYRYVSVCNEGWNLVGQLSASPHHALTQTSGTYGEVDNKFALDYSDKLCTSSTLLVNLNEKSKGSSEEGNGRSSNLGGSGRGDGGSSTGRRGSSSLGSDGDGKV